jgi:tetratricopeptide (TPR) repeat protein
VDRRAFLNDSIGVAAAAAMPAHVRPLSPTGRSQSVGTSHLLELREGLRALLQLDNAYGGGDVRSLAKRHLRRVRRVINTSQYPETIGRQLQLLSGEIAEHCAWLYYDADDQDTARRYWGEALTTATMLRDANLEVLIFSGMSLQASHEGRPRDGLDLARAAQERATALGSPILQSIIASREARALSLMNEEKAANRRLAHAMRLVDRGQTGRPSPEWAAFHGHAELDYAQGLLYTELGHHQAATPFLRAALSHQDRTYGRNRALYRLTLAKGLVQAGDVDEGAAHAVESIEHLEEVESGRVTRTLNQVTGLLHAVDSPTARQAAEELTEYAYARGAA